MRLHLLGLVAALPLVACSNDSQVLTGHVAAGFPQAISSIEVVSGATVVASAPVDASGAFTLHVAPGNGLALRLVGASGHDTIVFPRMTGSIDRTFSIRPGGAPFDLGVVRFVGDSSSIKFAFHGSDSGSACDDSGHDASGAMCCDDGGGDDGGTCEAGSGSATGSGGETGSGAGSGSAVIQIVAPDDGGGGGGKDDGSAGSDDNNDGDATCDHDFPDDGCAGDGSDHDGGGDHHGGGGQEADLPYAVMPQLGATATPILDAFASNGGVEPTAIVTVTEDAPAWRLTELLNSTPFVVTADDCSHIGNTGAAGRDRVFVTWTNADGSTMIDHLDIEYCSQ